MALGVRAGGAATRMGKTAGKSSSSKDHERSRPEASRRVGNRGRRGRRRPVARQIGRNFQAIANWQCLGNFARMLGRRRGAASSPSVELESACTLRAAAANPTTSSYTGDQHRRSLSMLPVSSLFASPWFWAGGALSVWGLAIVIQGICARARLTQPARSPSWDIVAFGFAVTAFMNCLALRSLGAFAG